MLELRRADGGARRPRRRNAAGESAGPAKAHHPRRARSGKPVDRRDADAGIDDHLAGADPRGSLRRCDRCLRGRRRRHAVGGKRVRAISDRSRGDDEPHRRGGGDASRSIAASSTLSAPPPKRPAPTPSASAARDMAENAGNDGHRRVDGVRRDRPARRPRAAARAHPDAHAQSRHGAPSDAGVGNARRRLRRTPTMSTTWPIARASSRCAGTSPSPATASSSSRACPSARRARPTWCASPSSRKTDFAHNRRLLASFARCAGLGSIPWPDNQSSRRKRSGGSCTSSSMASSRPRPAKRSKIRNRPSP